jgi:hypothetical protein
MFSLFSQEGGCWIGHDAGGSFGFWVEMVICKFFFPSVLLTVWADIGAETGEGGFKPRLDTLQRAMLELKISASRQGHV